MRFALLPLLALVLVSSVVRAQAPKEPPRSLRFYYAGFAQAGEAADPQARFLLRNGRENAAFRLTANAFSTTFDYTGPMPAPLFRERRTETGVERENLGELRFPANWKGVLFIITRAPAGQGFPFRFYPVEYWGPSVPDGHARVINLCPHPLGAKIGSSQAGIAAGASGDIPFPADRDDVPLRLAVRRGERWDLILSTAVERPARPKLLLLVFPNQDGVPRVLVLNDLPAPPETPEAQ